MEETKSSITSYKDGYSDENMLFTYSEREQEENRINRENAERVFSPKFIPFYGDIMEKYGLTYPETIIYGFIDFYLNGGGRFYFTNEQIGVIAKCSPDTASRSISKLEKLALLRTKRKIRSGGGQIRFIEIPKSDLGKTRCQTWEKLQTKHNKIKHNNINIYICSFEGFWDRYPKRVGRKKVEELYKRIVTSKEKEQALMEGLEKYIGKWTAEKTDVKYIPNPATWLNQERWEDEVVISNEQFNKNARAFESKWAGVKREYKAQEPVNYLADDGNGGLIPLKELLKLNK